jgi:thiol-disulfide isomerase/thioredoxin
LDEIQKDIGWTNVYALCKGQRIACCSLPAGAYEFALPPGDYVLEAYGNNVKEKSVNITVPVGQDDFKPDDIELVANNFPFLVGHTAPELDGVVGWKGNPTTLAGLKGKYVLLEFWGYWCGPCVQSMPVLIGLHEKFSDQGLAIVGVHVDEGGEVQTAEQLDEKIALHKKKIWKEKDLPFPVALCSGKFIGKGEAAEQGGAAKQYGIYSYPTTILIDRQGNVVGQFQARDLDSATKEIEKLLAEKQQ